MNFNKKMTIIIIISIIGILYIPLRLVSLKNNLIPIQGSLIEVTKSSTRIPFYRFRLSDYPNIFYNSGTGFLSNLKSDKEILYKSVNKEITFFINRKDFSKLGKGDDVKYVGLQKKNVFIDLFYYDYSSFGKVFFSMFCILMMCLNLYGRYAFKTKIFEIFILFYLFYVILILIL